MEEGVTQTDSSVTAIVTENMCTGQTSVCKMAKAAGAQVFPVDIGVSRPVEGQGLIQAKVMAGTHNMTQGPAMTRAQAVQAIETGIRLAKEWGANGYRILATGEMGIGNTTTSAAVASVLLHRPVEEMTCLLYTSCP